jgi:hypothetical protein
MSSRARQIVLSASLLLSLHVATQTATRAPLIWDDRALADWATPLASLRIRPGHYTSSEYYAVPADNLRTYPIYRPDREPPGYWDALQKKKPEPLVDASAIRTRRDWIAAGTRAFQEIDSVLTRSDDPALIALARDPKTFANVPGLADGTVLEPRWVVTDRGVMLSNLECASCHIRVTADRRAEYAGLVAPNPKGVGPVLPRSLFLQLATGRTRRTFGASGLAATLKRMFAVPWQQDERMDAFLSLPPDETIKAFFNPHGVIPRPNGSPLYGTRVPDLHTLQYSRYIDATGTHRLRGPEDVARYGALITGADPFEFGTHHLLSDEQRRVRFRYADEVLYAIGMYVMSLEPPTNPNPPPKDLVKRGERVFRREKCGACHPAPNYTTGELTPALGFNVPFDHPNFGDARDRSIGTDPGLALHTRKGTGFYKIPSLRGLWYRPRLLHDASIVTLEELFDPARLDPEYERKGWSPPGVTKGAVPGLEFLTKLSPGDKTALIAFLRSL